MPSISPTSDTTIAAGTTVSGVDFFYVKDITLTNYGQIVTHATTYGYLCAITSLGSSNISVDNYGLIEADGSTYPSFGGANANGFWLYLLPLISQIHNRATGVISANGTSATATLGEEVINEGTISAAATSDDMAAIGVASDVLSNTGTISATGHLGYAYGVVLGELNNYYGASCDKRTLINTGTISASSDTYSCGISYGWIDGPIHDEGFEITNYGTVSGTYAISCSLGDNAKIVNYGNLIGDISLVGSGNTLTNEGVIKGDVYLGFGTENYISVTGRIDGDLYSGNGTCLFSFGANYDPADAIYGGVGTDTVRLNGNYSTPLVIGEQHLMDVDDLVVAAGHNYSLQLDDVNVLAGHTLTVDGSALGTGYQLNFDGSRGHESTYTLIGGAGDDTLIAAAASTTKVITTDITRLKLLPDLKLTSGLDRDWVAFTPDGSKLYYMTGIDVLGDGFNSVAALYCKDLVGGTTTRIGLGPNGTDLNGSIGLTALSPDGTKLAFVSGATNLVAGDNNNARDVFIKDLTTGAVTLVSVTASGIQGNNNSGWLNTAIRFSPDGNTLYFTSDATNLVTGDTNGYADLFAKNLVTGVITRVSTAADGSQLDDASDPLFRQAISADGTKILFWSNARNILPGYAYAGGALFVKNLSTGAIQLVETSADGVYHNGFINSAALSSDGSKVLFISTSTSLVPGCTSGKALIYLKDLVTGAISCVSTDEDGIVADGNCATVSFSPDGTKVLFTSTADNLIPHDTNSNPTAYNATSDAFIKDLVTGEVTRVDMNSDGTESTGNVTIPLFSPDGSYVFFASDGMLTPDCISGFPDYYLAKLTTVTTGNDTLSGGDEHDTLTGGAGNDTLDGGSNIDTAVYSGNEAAYTITQTSTGNFTISGPDGTDTLTNVEYAKFTDQTVRLLLGTGTTIDWSADPSTYMAAIRDFDGNDLGAASGWKLIGTADVNGDGTAEHILVNRQNGRWAEVSTEADGKSYFANNGWAGDTRVVGIYIDPLVTSGEVVAGSDFDSQRRFQNDLNIENIHGILGEADYNHDGLQEIYFSLTDGTAYLHAYMHADGNIQYANYQNEQQVKDYLTANAFTSTTWAGWFPVSQSPLAAVAA